MILKHKGLLMGGNVSYSYSSYSNDKNNTRETHLVLLPPPSQPLVYQLSLVQEAYKVVLKQYHISPKHSVWKKVFCGDILNIQDHFEHFFSEEDSSVTMFIQQPPMPYRRFAIWIYFVEDDNQTLSQNDNMGCLERANYSYHIYPNLIDDKQLGSYDQTESIFNNLNTKLKASGMTMEENLHRTWIYVNNVDNNYAGLVEARKAIFNQEGLTRDTHYIASTGIEGKPRLKKGLISMDALAIKGLQKEQVQYVNAYDYLNNTADYGVTFERATSIVYGDRKTIYISGTASIDNEGEVVHVGDVQKQTYRAIENIDALLKSAETNLEAILHLIVYLRDPADHRLVVEILEEKIGEDVNYVMVYGPVCRPEWLVEIEGIAICDVNTEFAPF